MKRSTNEKVVGLVSLASIIIAIFGLLFPCFSSWFSAPVFDHIAVFCWALCVVPFMSLQFFIPSGIYVYFFSNLHVVLRIIIFCVLAPIANVWFFFWLGALFNSLPSYEKLSQVIGILLAYSSSLAWVLSGMGIAIRLIKQKKILSKIGS